MASSPYYVTQVAGKGLGVLASSNIKKDEIVVRESPIVQVNLGLKPDGVDLAEWIPRSTTTITMAVNRLNTSDRASYDELYASDKIIDDTRRRLESKCTTAESDMVAKFIMNCFTDLEGHYMICRTHTKLNHSCAPNAVSRWNPASKQLEVVATVDIAKDEEICVSYIWLAMPRAQREQMLKELRHDFHCCCLACGTSPLMEEQYSLDSEWRRTRMHTLMLELTATSLMWDDQIDKCTELAGLIHDEPTMIIEKIVFLGALSEYHEEDDDPLAAKQTLEQIAGLAKDYTCYAQILMSELWSHWQRLNRKTTPSSELTPNATYLAAHVTNPMNISMPSDPYFFRNCLRAECNKL